MIVGLLIDLLVGSRRSPRARSSCLALLRGELGALQRADRDRRSARNDETFSSSPPEARADAAARGSPSSSSASRRSSTRLDRPSRYDGDADPRPARRVTAGDRGDDRSARRTSESSSRRCGRPRPAAASASSCSRTSCRDRPAAGRLRACSTRSRPASRVDASSAPRTAAAGRRQVPARQLRANRLGAERRRAAEAPREGVRPRRQGPHRRDRGEVHPPGLSARSISPSCTCRPRRSTTSVVRGKTGALLAYAHERRVFPVSPTTFTAYLQMIVLG